MQNYFYILQQRTPDPTTYLVCTLDFHGKTLNWILDFVPDHLSPESNLYSSKRLYKNIY